MEILDATETAARLPYAALADAIRGVALARHSDTVQAPPRLALPLPNRAVLLVMPAADGDLAITKLVTVHPENPGHGRPTIQGEVVVMEASTGTRLGLLDGAPVTARRTAAPLLPRGPGAAGGAGRGRRNGGVDGRAARPTGRRHRDRTAHGRPLPARRARARP